MRIRKQDYRLSLADLMQSAAWEYTLDEEWVKGRDERTVRPYHASEPLDPNRAYFIVRARFYFADDTRMVGYIKPIKLRGPRFMEPVVPIDMNPVIVTEQGQIAFWYGASKPDAQEILKNYEILGRKPSDVFPISFSSDVEVLDSITEGIIVGFLYCDENVQDFFNLKPTDIKAVT